jgi:hypothetical protein
MRILKFALLLILPIAGTSPALGQQVFPPGTFGIDGLPVVCGSITFVSDPNLPDVGMARPGYIILNPNVFARLPTTLKLFWAGHECGHHVLGVNESAADCWAIRTGRNQGWFPPQAFYHMMEMFKNNQGDMTHPPGPARVQSMLNCYLAP